MNDGQNAWNLRNRLTALALSLLSAAAAAQPSAEFVAIGRLGVVVHQPDTGAVPHVAVIYENGSSEFNSMCEALAQRGFLTLCVIEAPESNGGWERVALDVKAAVEYARGRPGIGKVVLYGHSGGGAVASFYQAVAENGVAFCKAPTKLSVCGDDLAGLPPADAVLFPDAHPGMGVMALRMINPALSGDGARLRVNAEMDPFNPANGFRRDGPSHYSREFQEKYAQAQAEAMTRLIAVAQRLQAGLRSGAITNSAADRVSIPEFGFANHLDELDPNALGLMGTRLARRLLRNDGTVVSQVIRSVSRGNPAEAPIYFKPPTAFVASSAQFLSRDAVRAKNSIDDIDWCSSNSVTMCNVQSIHVPVLFIASGAGTFIADDERMYEKSPAIDKEYIVVEGALHAGKPCVPCETVRGEYADSEANLYNHVAAWLNQRF